MSRKFLDDNVELLLTIPSGSTSPFASLPKTTSKTFKRGHVALAEDAGIRFLNYGNTTVNSLWLSPDYNAVVLEDKMETLPVLIANATVFGASQKSLLAAGTNSANAGATFATEGGITLTTTTGSGDQEVIANTNTYSNFGTVTLITDNGLVWESQVVTGSAVTSQVLWAGLKLTFTSVVATDDDQAFFRYAAATDGFWHFVTSVGGTDVDTATTVALAATTTYLLQIRIGTDRKPHYFINGVRVGIGAALTASLTTLKSFVGVQTATTAAKALTCRYVKITRPRTPLNT